MLCIDFFIFLKGQNFKILKYSLFSESMILKKECIAMFPMLASIETRKLPSLCVRNLHYQRTLLRSNKAMQS